MNKFLTLLGGVVLGAAMASAANFTQCPAIGADTNGCELLITVSAVNGSGAATAFTVAVSSPDQGPLNDSDVTLIGIVNNSGATLNSIMLIGDTDIFGFNGSGACSGFGGVSFYSPAPTLAQCGGAYTFPSPDTAGTDYASAGVSFSGINVAQDTGTVNFDPGIANGSSSWFSLEEALSPSSFTNAAAPTPGATPEPGTALLLGGGLIALGLIRSRRR